MWTLLDTSKARGAARNPKKPIAGTWIFESVVPTARPTHTKADQVTFLTRSATSDVSPNTSPNPAASRSNNASIARPSATASHATRNSVTPAFWGAVLAPDVTSSPAEEPCVLVGVIGACPSSRAWRTCRLPYTGQGPQGNPTSPV
ncbi:MAG: hypothetical protein AVDCRST_MAG03-223 [uncultured Rubrobacteraceae bacterium]|uniref:Uncharacterized protein n=1 Tax=uncultured Rubrobacteraceae bacterium TaxID=349277 RepID=A0A6J4NE18_9ACTN|nr:MAG: hypothetical protein AVDCRST_MAG03-223 [uncultured Rubrobacteraceae bacterium]